MVNNVATWEMFLLPPLEHRDVKSHCYKNPNSPGNICEYKGYFTAKTR